jgi:hypothetical protein
VAWVAPSYRVAFVDSGANPTAVAGVLVRPDGSLVGDRWLGIAREDGNIAAPAITEFPRGGSLVAYDRFLPAPRFGARRARVRTWSLPVWAQ